MNQQKIVTTLRVSKDDYDETHARIQQAARRDALSMNTWMIRAVMASCEQSEQDYRHATFNPQ